MEKCTGYITGYYEFYNVRKGTETKRQPKTDFKP